jgi:cytidylate kinase
VTDARARPTITVGGLAGTGSSTLSRLLASRLGLAYEYAGGIFRAEASRRGLTVEEFNALCEADPAVDRTLDERQLELLRAGGLLLEGRMAGWLAARHGLDDVMTVWVVCDDEERFRRLRARDGGSEHEVMERTLTREASEQDRFRRFHGADILDPTLYDLVLDSTSTSPEDLVVEVVAALGD